MAIAMDSKNHPFPLSSSLKCPGLSMFYIDEIRQENAAYEYLCHLEEARLWVETCIQETLPHSTELETRLRNGVYLAKLGNFIAPHVVPLKKIFDIDQNIYDSSGLHYRHTDNINHWILAMKAIGLPSYFYPNSFDVYGKKNMPRAIYCLHALNIYLHRCGKGMKIIDLMGKIQFSPDEISSVTKDFKLYGIQLPVFSNIGGILANEISANDATLHAAIIAINIAIGHQNSEHLYAAMTNPNAQLQNVYEHNAKCYQKALSKLKYMRAEEVKSKTASHKIELCWEFLPRKVIQEEIDSVNINCVLSELKNVVCARDKKAFIKLLNNPLLDVSGVLLDNVEVYMSQFKNIFDNQGISNIENVHDLITSVNYDEYKNTETSSAVVNLNSLLSSEDYISSFNILKSLALGVRLHDFGRQFYHIQLENIKLSKGSALDLCDLEENLPKLTALLDLSIAVMQGDADSTFKALSNEEIKCWELHPNLKYEYIKSLREINFESYETFLTVDLVQKHVSEVNIRFELNQNEIASTINVNTALCTNNMPLLINSLISDPSILSVDSKHTQLYFDLLSKCQAEKNNFELSRTDIQSQINKANKLVLEAEYYCAILASINMAVDNKDPDVLFDSLKIMLDIETLCSGCKIKYLEALAIVKNGKTLQCSPENDVSQYSWIKWEVFPLVTYFLNMITLENAWNMEKEGLVSMFLNKAEITELVSETKSACQCYKYTILEPSLVSFQAFARGYLVRRKLYSRRLMLSRTYTPEQAVAAVKVQSFLRMSIVRKKYLEKRAEKLRLDSAARIIQRQWRAFKVFKNLSILAHSSNPPLPLMQKIIYMLEISNDDYSEEFKLHTIKGKAVQTIRYNQSLLKEIDEMDLKIGLLIRNRISLEDLLLQKKRASTRVKKREISIADMKSQNFKLFSKNYNSLIESYENLLYVLQTRPEYLSTLIVNLPSNQATTFIESFIFSLYNYGSTPREEYLLLKMLCLTLNEEIKLRGDDLSDIIKGENMIMKIIISFYRKSYWRDCLKSLLEPLVSEVLNDKCVLYSIDPVEIYKVWQNELETLSGKKSTMPQDLSVDDVLAHQEVNNRFNQFLDNLLKYSLTFCDAIVNGQELIPYGIMYVCKFLKLSLLKKYPASSTKELYKIIGNFLYYRYINPAIVAPDVFDIISNQPNHVIVNHERMKLSAIAKFLHFAVTGKKYLEDTPHLMYLNPYLSDCHQKFVAFFDDVCNVKSLEEQFNIDMFSEALVQIPEVYMSLKELQTLHKLLIEKEYDIAPDSNDLLHEIFEDFKPDMLEGICNSSDEFLKTEICLSLKSKYELEVDDETEEEKTFVETKFMLITLLQVFLDVDSITDLIEREISDEEEMTFEKICFMKQRDADFSRNWIKKSRDWKTLSSLQSALLYNLNYLELHGFVSSQNNYQEILNDIAKDIVNRWRYRISRKKEISKLLEIQKQLDSKTVYYLEKLDYYNRYIAACLENMKIGKPNSNLFICRSSATDQVLNSKTVKCSGSKLFEKGILIKIKDLDASQFKNVHFEISPTEDLGIFTIRAKFMGIPLETVDIDIQELLCRQYQGISEMNMFDCVKINNNLLLHFLNSKFYSKKVL